MCLRWIARTRRASWPRVLDYGCGSGILAIGAALHGADAVDAVDIDPAAVEATRANAAANGVRAAAGARPRRRAGRYAAGAGQHPGHAAEAARAAARAHVAPGGDLVLAGILERQADELRAAYAPWLPTGSVADARRRLGPDDAHPGALRRLSSNPGQRVAVVQRDEPGHALLRLRHGVPRRAGPAQGVRGLGALRPLQRVFNALEGLFDLTARHRRRWPQPRRRRRRRPRRMRRRTRPTRRRSEAAEKPLLHTEDAVAVGRLRRCALPAANCRPTRQADARRRRRRAATRDRVDARQPGCRHARARPSEPAPALHARRRAGGRAGEHPRRRAGLVDRRRRARPLARRCSSASCSARDLSRRDGRRRGRC